MKKLYIITSGYPYLAKEKPFLLTELHYLKERYDVTLFTRARGEIDPELPEGVNAVQLGNKTGKFRAALYCLKAFFTPAFYKELRNIRKTKSHIKEKIKNCLIHFIIAAQFNDQLRREFKMQGTPDIVYSYWGSASLTGMALFRKKREKWRLIARCHNYDLFEERAPFCYHPFKHQVDTKTDAMFLVCQGGYDYYLHHWSRSTPPICHIGKLGSSNSYGLQPYTSSTTLRIVSCSLLVPVKRVEMLIDSLSLIDNMEINWTHYGNGKLEDSLKNMAQTKLGAKNNISYNFAGYVDNTQLKKIYSQKTFDVFITVSEYEGLPVSVMEAISFGIPVIATAAVGMDEIVGNDNGILLPVQSTAQDICDAITAFASLSEEERLSLRQASRKKWEDDFCAEDNAKAFTAAIGDVERRK